MYPKHCFDLICSAREPCPGRTELIAKVTRIRADVYSVIVRDDSLYIRCGFKTSRFLTAIIRVPAIIRVQLQERDEANKHRFAALAFWVSFCVSLRA